MDEKVQRLREILQDCSSVCIGYSGGVDSVFLACMAVDTLGAERVLAVTGRSAAYPAVQHDIALDCARRFGIPHAEVETDELSDPNYTANPANRCYYCKSELWPKLQEVARQRGLRTVLDGSNADDAHDYRPGFAAAQEHAVRSPLLEAGLAKEEIRELSRRRGLPTWDQPSAPCLSSRLPYGVAVTPARLRQVEVAETLLRDLGFVVFRVRHHDDAMRIEVAPDELPAAEARAARIAAAFSAAGLPPALLDAEGYRRGALNEVLVRIEVPRRDNLAGNGHGVAASHGHDFGGGGDVTLPEHAAAGQQRDICVLSGCSAAEARELAAAARAAGFRYVSVRLDSVVGVRWQTPRHPVRELTYLDFAATSAPRPPAVAAAVSHYLSDIGASAGRGGHRLANEAGRLALHCRQRLAALLGAPGDAGRIAFAANATHALNIGIWGTVGRGERMVVTALDHNSVLRPAARLARERNAHVVMVAAAADGSLDMRGLERALDGARLFCITAASNVLGTRTDIAALAAAARSAGALTLVDAAQAVGHLPVDATAVDMLAFTGHKGLLGPPGIGGIWVRDGLDVDPIITGGTGGNSLQRDMPAVLPDRLEAGTLNGAGIAGLLAGTDHVLAEGVASLHARLSDLKLRLHHGLSGIRGLRVLSPAAPSGVPIVTVISDVMDAATLAARLDREHGIITRAGLHCAPEVHRLLGTDRSGAVRFSLGWCSTTADVDRAVEAVSAIVAGHGVTA